MIKIFFYSSNIEKQDKFSNYEVYIGTNPPFDPLEYDYFCIMSDEEFPRVLVEKIVGKPILVIGNGVCSSTNLEFQSAFGRKSNNTHILDSFIDSISGDSVKFEFYSSPGKTIKPKDNHTFNTLYAEGYLNSYKSIPSGSTILLKDIRDYPLVWKYKSTIWIGFPKIFGRLRSYYNRSHSDGEKISECSVLLSVLVSYVFNLKILEESIEPKWASTVLFDEETHLMKESLELNKKLNENYTRLIKYKTIKGILWSKGSVLENAVKILFDDLGISYIKKYGSDLIVTYNKTSILFEIKGMRKNLDHESRREIDNQLYTHKKEWETREGQKPKLCVVINQQCETPPAERSPLSKQHVDILLKDFDCCIISSTELFKIYQLIQQNRLSKEKFLSYIVSNAVEIKLTDILD